MRGQMMTLPLTIPSILDFATKYHGDTEIVSRTVEGPIHRYGYADAARRTRQLAKALRALGVNEGDIVGTLAWNGYRHFELSYAVPSVGAVCHTINPRLFPAQIAYIINHADDRHAWGIPFAAPMTGCKLVFPGPHLDGVNLQQLIENEDVTISAGVPTVWMNLLHHVETANLGLGRLNRVIIGGSACPGAMLQAFERRGVHAIHAWGMTETSPLGAINAPKARTRALPEAEQAALALKQGRPPFGVDLKIVDDDGKDLPFDGASFGKLKARGHWVCGSYFRLDSSAAHDEPGWFDTGDVATIDGDGTMQIVDRSKDLIKSGGEWISSIELENIAVAHPAVKEAAAIGRRDAKWGERPVVIAVLRPGMIVSADELRGFYRGKLSKWCEPDEVIIAESLPHNATGKLLKSELRKRFG